MAVAGSENTRGYFDRLGIMSRRMWDSYEDRGLPAMSAFADRVNEYDSPAALRSAEGMAASDVGRSYDRARANMSREMARYGMRPDSGRRMAGLRALALGEAADRAGARTTARRGILDRGLAHRSNLASLYSTMAGQSLTGTQAGGIGHAGIDQNIRHANLAKYTADLGSATSRYLGELGADTSRYAADRNVQAALASGRSSSGSSIGSILGGIAGIAGLFSDRRLKTNAVRIDALPNGLPVYEFNYVDDPETLYTGLMADEVIEVMPEHVSATDGFLVVDYHGVMDDILRAAA